MEGNGEYLYICHPSSGSFGFGVLRDRLPEQERILALRVDRPSCSSMAVRRCIGRMVNFQSRK